MHKNSVPRLRFQGFAGEWERKTLGSVVEIVGGGTPDTTNPNYWNGNIDWYSPSEIGETVYANQSMRKITALGLQKSSATMLPADKTVLFTSRASIGDMAILTKDGATNQGFQSFIVGEELDVYFLYSMGFKIKEFALKNASGSTFLEVSKNTLAKMELLAPTKPEQTALGDFFRRLDETLAQARARLAKTQQLKRAMLAKLFPAHGETAPKLRFQGFSGEWERKTLGEVADFAKGKGLSKSSIENGGQIPCILYGELYTKYGCCIDKVVSSTNENIENPTLSKSNDVLMPTSDVTPNGLAKACAIYLDDIVLGGDILVIRSNKMLGLFFAYFVENNPSAIIEKATGTTVFHIYAKDLMSVEIPMPSYEEQTAIGNFFQKLDQTLALQSAALEKLTQLKKALLAAMLV